MAFAQIAISVLGDKLALPEDMEVGWWDPEACAYNPSFPPSPHQLRFKILIKAKVSTERSKLLFPQRDDILRAGRRSSASEASDSDDSEEGGAIERETKKEAGLRKDARWLSEVRSREGGEGREGENTEREGMGEILGGEGR